MPTFLEAVQELQRRIPQAQLKPKQAEVLSALLEGRNVYAGLPTAYGKSLCYWLPAAAWGWRVWVISPLISLIEDQSASLARLGVPTMALHSSLGAPSLAKRESELLEGNWRVLFLSPEKLQAWWDNGTIALLDSAGLTPQLVALDEMHCFEDWRNFRAAYQAAFEPVRRMLGRGTRLLGLSASFSLEQSDLWMREFCETYVRVDGGLGRENLSLFVCSLEEENPRWMILMAALRDLHGPETALIYCASRRECDELSHWLQCAGIDAVPYHAGLPPAVREARSRAFCLGFLRVVCATSAFGMGIDYPHVRRVIHFSLPYDLESYWQEVGRAGRDGVESYALAFWRRSEIIRFKFLPAAAVGRYEALWRAWIKPQCRKRAVAERLGLRLEDCGKCDRCDSSLRSLPDWLASWRNEIAREPWWLSTAAEPERWLDKKILAYRKDLDASLIPDNFSA